MAHPCADCPFEGTILENRNSVDQRRQAALRFIAAHRHRLARGGSLAATWRRRAAARTGPYYLLVVRDVQGRRMSVYLGVASPLVEEVRGELARLQAPLRKRQILRGAQRQLRRALRQARQQLDRDLASTSLRRKGCEIRGWRSCRAGLATRSRGPSIQHGNATGASADRAHSARNELQGTRVRLPPRPRIAVAWSSNPGAPGQNLMAEYLFPHRWPECVRLLVASPHRCLAGPPRKKQRDAAVTFLIAPRTSLHL